MKIKNLLLITALVAAFPSLHAAEDLQQLLSQVGVYPYCPAPQAISLHAIKEMLYQKATFLNAAVINKVLTILKCTNRYNIEHNNILTVIDYSLPANEKRLWIFNLAEKKLLFHTYVSHGIKSGALLSTLFSNKYDSKSSSLGVYKTEQTYRGRDGLSLRLAGLDNGFNSNASNRYIVMHGSWYVDENFIKKYGRSGRSWGCPAVPLDLTEPIINTIKDESLLIVYYPNDDWLTKSKFLRCGKLSPQQDMVSQGAVSKPVIDDSVKRDAILFADIHKNGTGEENTAVAVLSADNYARIFQLKAPLDRMLRRQIDKIEYIALSPAEFAKIKECNQVYFARPVIKMIKGYYETQMDILNFGKITQISLNGDSGYTVHFDTKNSLVLRSTDRFIRWLGL